jgi:DnaJ like chaperone protein
MTTEPFKMPRHWWGKIIGAVLGFLKGGLTGALLGALLGHMADRFFAAISGVGTTRDAFFQALFCSLGHLSKADGQVTPAEIRMAESLMARMQISGEERQRAIAFFNQGKQAGFKLEESLRTFVQHSVVRPDLRQMFLGILVEAAFTSGPVTPAEQSVLLRVAQELRIPQQVFAAMLLARQGGAGAQRGQQPGPGVIRPPLEQAFAQLGLKSSASDAEVKKAYRKLVSQYHPDKLVSRGLPAEMMEMAKTRVREINVAYEQIKKTRGFK